MAGEYDDNPNTNIGYDGSRYGPGELPNKPPYSPSAGVLTTNLEKITFPVNPHEVSDSGHFFPTGVLSSARLVPFILPDDYIAGSPLVLQMLYFSFISDPNPFHFTVAGGWADIGGPLGANDFSFQVDLDASVPLTLQLAEFTIENENAKSGRTGIGANVRRDGTIDTNIDSLIIGQVIWRYKRQPGF